MSLVESAANVAVGYATALGAQAVVFPYFDIHVGLAAHAGISAAFTGVSLVRSYALRRAFDRILHRRPA